MEEEEEEEEEGLFKADAVNEEDPRARPRYPGVEGRATLLRETGGGGGGRGRFIQT